jgi:hypothetical protein
MKATFLRVFAMSLTLIAGVSAFAQSGNALRVNIPFDFVVGTQKLTAGQYSVEESQTNGLVTLYNVDSKQTATIITEPSAPRASDTDSRLTFEKHNGSAYLVRVLSATGSPREVVLHSAK